MKAYVFLSVCVPAELMAVKTTATPRFRIDEPKSSEGRHVCCSLYMQSTSCTRYECERVALAQGQPTLCQLSHVAYEPIAHPTSHLYRLGALTTVYCINQVKCRGVFAAEPNRHPSPTKSSRHGVVRPCPPSMANSPFGNLLGSCRRRGSCSCGSCCTSAPPS